MHSLPVRWLQSRLPMTFQCDKWPLVFTVSTSYTKKGHYTLATMKKGFAVTHENTEWRLERSTYIYLHANPFDLHNVFDVGIVLAKNVSKKYNPKMSTKNIISGFSSIDWSSEGGFIYIYYYIYLCFSIFLHLCLLPIDWLTEVAYHSKQRMWQRTWHFAAVSQSSMERHTTNIHFGSIRERLRWCLMVFCNTCDPMLNMFCKSLDLYSTA